MLSSEIIDAQRLVKTDAYQMSIGEIVTMYESHELIIDPEFQRLFRWDIGQKSKLIESLLLGIPIPSIFVFEKNDGSWELIDGLQRISTILEFMGKLKNPENKTAPPSVLEATKYLPSLHNTVWERSSRIPEVPKAEQNPLDKGQQLSIRRARLGLEILKKPSEDKTKFDLFQRLNAGGTQANAQELRNCIMLMVNGDYFRSIKAAAESADFQTVTSLTPDQTERQRHMELAVRFLVLTYVPYDGTLDVEEFIDEGIIDLAREGEGAKHAKVLVETFKMLNAVAGKDVLKRFEKGKYGGKTGLVGLEGIAVGVAKNLNKILALKDPVKFLTEKIHKFWDQPQTKKITSPGLRGTTRIQRTVPFGKDWFSP